MSVIVEKTINNDYVNEKHELEEDEICDICFVNMKDDLLKCKECNNSICFSCFNKSPLKTLGFNNIDEQEIFENGEGHIFHIQDCFFCRTKNYYRISDFKKNELNILTNNIVKNNLSLLGKYKEIFQDIRDTNNKTKSNYKTKIIDKTICYIAVKEREDNLNSKLKRFEGLEENFLKMKEELDKLKKSYNENIKDYNNIVRETNFLKNSYNEIGIANMYICNQRDSYKNTYVNGINEIKSKNKNKNLEKFIDNKIKELDKQTTEVEIGFGIEINELNEK